MYKFLFVCVRACVALEEISSDLQEREILGPYYCTSIGERNETFFIRVWKHLSNIRVLKTLRENLKGKPKEDNIC